MNLIKELQKVTLGEDADGKKYTLGIPETEIETKICIEIAENFAIGFAKWLYKWDNTRLPNGNWIIRLGLKAYTSEEVLEIYKKTLE